ncbi:MAG: RecX family transcriptional regulator [Planctomycetota bacterium]
MTDERPKKKRPRPGVRDRLRAIEEAPTGETVKRVRPVAGGEQWTLTLEGGASFRLGSSVLMELQLGVGEEWTAERALRARGLQGFALARHDGLMIVQRRAVTRKGLVDALAKKGHDRADAGEAAEALERVGLIDDARVAEAAARSASRKGDIGVRLLEQKLMQKGVGREDAKAAAAGALEGRDIMEDALGLARKKARSSAGRLEHDAASRRIAASLARRGFDPETCRQATRRALRECAEGYDGD